MTSYDPTLSDKLLLIPNLVRAVATVLARPVVRPFSSGPKPKSWIKDLYFTLLRAFVGPLNIRQDRIIAGSTDKVYLNYMKKTERQPQTDVFDSGIKLHWIGSKDAEKTLLYFHGGGFVLALSPAHMAWLSSLQKEVSKKSSFSIAVLSYTLAPKGHYPLQLTQAAESLAWLHDKLGKKFSNILIGGDSAGGNLALSLTSHLLHPHPEVSKSVNLSLNEPLAGVILVSPWIQFPPDVEAFDFYEKSDMLVKSAGDRWSAAYLGPNKLDNYNQPLLADADWFSSLESKVKGLIVWGGGSEVLINSIKAIADKLKQAYPKTDVVIEPGSAHEDFIFDKGLGLKISEGAEVMEKFVKSKL